MATQFENTIKNYLDSRAKEDSLFAEAYKKANKSIKECCKYIYSQARKLAKGSNSVGIDDATVYGWAVHYYDEDDIKVDKVQERVEVVAPVAIQKPVKEEKPVQQKAARKKTKQELQKIFESRQLSLFDM
ncbi:PcfK-like family protein [Phocaeicola coprocola]|uniref:PcfK-like family protein n=1 Tax=Phocaeicola coprocola TaxID=310298 RepID=UPI00266EEA55|nr:Cas9 inhibitor AcrIIA9 family protein [Phocaeicola coprocola]